MGIGLYREKIDIKKEKLPLINMEIDFKTIPKEEPMIAKNEEPVEELSTELPPPPPPEEPTSEPVEEKAPEIKEPEPKEVVKNPIKKKKVDKKSEKKPIEKKEVKKTSDEPTKKPAIVTDVFGNNKNFKLNGDGSYTALSSKGINYKIISSPPPAYPAKADQGRYRRDVSVRARITVGLRGNVENVQILSGNSGMGFDDEVRKALRSWKFKPIYYNNRNIKMQFTRTFHFKSRY